MTTSTLPQGIRLNNPGNLRGAILTEGAGPRENGFQSFGSMTIGLANLMALSHQYVYRIGLTTPDKFFARYAPVSENKTSAYVDFMTEWMADVHSHPSLVMLNLLDDWTMVKFCQGISIFENGHPTQHWATFTQWFSTREAADAWEIMLKWNAAQSSKA